MAEYLAAIFGTEKDRVNCSLYFKIKHVVMETDVLSYTIN